MTGVTPIEEDPVVPSSPPTSSTSSTHSGQKGKWAHQRTIPSEQVEMPGCAVASLDVQFGSIKFLDNMDGQDNIIAPSLAKTPASKTDAATSTTPHTADSDSIPGIREVPKEASLPVVDRQQLMPSQSPQSYSTPSSSAMLPHQLSQSPLVSQPAPPPNLPPPNMDNIRNDVGHVTETERLIKTDCFDVNSGWETLSFYILEDVFLHLDILDVLQCARVSTHWFNVVYDKIFQKKSNLLKRMKLHRILDMGNHEDLWAASRDGVMKTVKLQLRKLLLGRQYNEINKSGNYGKTPLNYASHMGHLAITRLLLKSGADVNISDINRVTPLNSASIKGHLAIVKSLIKYEADPHIAGEGGMAPLDSASYKGHKKIVLLLIQYGADPNKADATGATPLNCAASEGRVGAVKILLQGGADPDLADAAGATPIKNAASEGQVGTVRVLLQGGADPDIADASGTTPINDAASKGHVGTVRALLKGGADLHKADAAGATPINRAIAKNRRETMEVLLKSGADPDKA